MRNIMSTNPPNRVKPKAVGDPVIIDYPKDRTLLKEEFAKIAARPGFSESVEMAKEVIQGNRGKRTVRLRNDMNELPAGWQRIGEITVKVYPNGVTATVTPSNVARGARVMHAYKEGRCIRSEHAREEYADDLFTSQAVPN